MNGVAAQAQQGPAQDRVPEPKPTFPAIAGQQRAGGVEGRDQAAVGMAFEGRPPDAGRGVPEVDLGVISTASPAWCRRGSRRPRSAEPGKGIVRTSRPVSASRIRQVGGFDSLSTTAIRAPSGRKARSASPGAGPSPAGPDRSPGRRSRSSPLFGGQGDPPAVRAESGRAPMNGPRVVHGDGVPLDVPDRQGMAGRMRGRQIAAVGAEAEDPDLAIAPGRKRAISWSSATRRTEIVPSRNRRA